MAERIPAIARGGVGIEVVNPQPEVRRNAENARDWPYAEEASYLYRMAAVFKDRFIDPVALADRPPLPEPVISFANLRNMKVLAAYSLVRNPQGLLDEITFNTQHYVTAEVDGVEKLVWEYGRWAQLETLLHEQIHLWQQNFGEDPVRPGRVYHNKEFVVKCESLGLHPKLGEGYHLKVADGLFADMMKELGINPPALPDTQEEIDTDWFKWLLKRLGKERQGRSTLHKWTCPECGLIARIGVSADPQLRHHACEEKIGQIVFLKREG